MLYNERLDEGYDLETDELYCIWSKMKKLCIKDGDDDSAKASSVISEQMPNPFSLPTRHQRVSPAVDDILTYPNPPDTKKKGKSTSDMPKHLSSEQVISYLEDKKAQKQQEEEEKKANGRMC